MVQHQTTFRSSEKVATAKNVESDGITLRILATLPLGYLNYLMYRIILMLI
jgi:hypothetical protein